MKYKLVPVQEVPSKTRASDSEYRDLISAFLEMKDGSGQKVQAAEIQIDTKISTKSQQTSLLNVINHMGLKGKVKAQLRTIDKQPKIYLVRETPNEEE